MRFLLTDYRIVVDCGSRLHRTCISCIFSLINYNTAVTRWFMSVIHVKIPWITSCASSVITVSYGDRCLLISFTDDP